MKTACNHCLTEVLKELLLDWHGHNYIDKNKIRVSVVMIFCNADNSLISLWQIKSS